MHEQNTNELLSLFGQLLEELRHRGICRSENVPTGDLAEYLACRALALTPAKNSNKGFDAVDAEGRKYQIKGRRVTARNPSRQLSAIRELEREQFDYVIAVLFDSAFQVEAAYRFTRAACLDSAKFVSRTNSHTIFASEPIVARTDTSDLTDVFRQTLAAL